MIFVAFTRVKQIWRKLENKGSTAKVRVLTLPVESMLLLTEEEKSRVTYEVKRIYPNATSLAMYGSRALGYAREDSDYDTLVVVPGFKGGIRYRYIKGDLPIAALVTSKSALSSDVKYAIMGEFLAGRLLLPIELLEDDGTLDTVVKTYRSKVFIEGLMDIAGHGPIASELIMPLEYPAFLRMSERMDRYPPLEYSYSMAFSQERYGRNMSRLRSDYLPIARELVESGLIREVEGGYALEERVTSKSLSRAMSKALSNIAKLVGSYLTHAYAGIFEVENIVDEVASKVKRSGGPVPEVLKNPRQMLRLPEGTLTFGNWRKELQTKLGVDGDRVRMARKHLTDASYLCEYRDDRNRVRFVVKNYSSLTSRKWMFLAAAFTPVVEFKVSSVERMGSEYKFNRRLRNIEGLGIAGILLVDLKSHVTVEEYVEASNLEEIISRWYGEGEEDRAALRGTGRCLGKAHSEGISICDTKPNNLLWKDGRLWFVDLEQARFGRPEEFAWDVAEFVYYSAINRTKFDLLSDIMREFLSGYLETGPREALRVASGKKYLLPFTLLVLPHVLLGLNRVIAEFGGVDPQEGEKTPRAGFTG